LTAYTSHVGLFLSHRSDPFQCRGYSIAWQMKTDAVAAVRSLTQT
jgi:hypothetical protein